MISRRTATLLTVFFGLSISATVFADPNNGDTAVYKGTAVNASGVPAKATITFSIDRYDPINHTFIYKTETLFDGTTVPHITEELTDESGIANRLILAGLLQACEADGGKKETLKVPAGTFKTCRTVSGDHRLTSNFGVVPFGTIKEIDDNFGTQKTLVSFKYGKK